MGFLNTSCVTLIQTIPRIWEKWIRTVRKKYGKHKHLKVKGLWNFLLEAEIHAVPNMWEKWISIIRGKYGKTQTFQIYGFPKNFGWSRNPYNSQNMGKVNSYKYGKSMGKKTNIPKFLKYFGWSRNPYNTQNMEKVNSNSKEKIWENTNISKFSASENFRLMQKSMQFPKHGKSGFPLYGKSMEKHKHFKFMGFFKYFGWSRNPYNSQNLGKVNFHNTGKVWEKNKHSKVMGFSNVLGEAEIHTIPKIWEKWIYIVREK